MYFYLRSLGFGDNSTHLLKVAMGMLVTGRLVNRNGFVLASLYLRKGRRNEAKHIKKGSVGK